MPELRTVPTAGLSAAELADLYAGALAGAYVLAPLPPDPVEQSAVRDLLTDPGPLPDDTALVVSTSGSTGAPKAVLLSGRAIRAGAAATHEHLGGAGDWTLALGAHYVAGAMVVCRAVLAGTRVHLAGSDLGDLPASRPGTRSYLSVVPTQLARVADDAITVDALGRFDAVLVGGAAIDPALLAGWRSRGVRLVTTYGASETCGGCVYDGRPLPGVRVRAVGGAGRLVIESPTLFGGYLGRPDLTAEVLVDGGRTYLTGDRGAVAADGTVEVFGRLDEVIISGGLNIDLALVEASCRAALGTTEVAALGVPDPLWGRRVVVVTTAPVGLAELRDRLTGRLARHALPRGLSHTEVLPHTSSGKIDRRTLLGAWDATDKELV